MQISAIELMHLKMPLVRHFETSFGRVFDQETLVVKVAADGVVGYGESAASANPYYSAETVVTCGHIIKDFIAPVLMRTKIGSPSDLPGLLKRIRGNNIAKAGVEMALWDAHARLNKLPLWKAYGGTKGEILSGVSLGITDTPKELLALVGEFVSKGYPRIKLKIKQGWDVDIIAAVRKEFPDIRLTVDANAAYTPAESAILKELDAFGLEMIEQPFSEDDLFEHARLQAVLKTPICLDESIKGPSDAERALEMGSCRIINIKQARVGGFTNARKIHDICMKKGVPVWCGGLLESGIGRIHNIALATLPGFTLPNDISGSDRYYARDVITPPVKVINGRIAASNAIGLEGLVDEKAMDGYVVDKTMCSGA